MVSDAPNNRNFVAKFENDENLSVAPISQLSYKVQITVIFSPGRQAEAKQSTRGSVSMYVCMYVCMYVPFEIFCCRRSWKLKLWWNVVWVHTTLHAKFEKNQSQFWVPNGNPFLLYFSSFRTCLKLKLGSCM